jgi:ubiquitin carboxyl-terminal hydrolase 25
MERVCLSLVSEADVVFAQKEEGKASEEIALKAIATIAKARKSENLNNFILTGEQSMTATLSVDEALRRLNVESKLEELDQSMLQYLFQSARQDRPGQWTEDAIHALEFHIKEQKAVDAATWPVGLITHGNTCYLNSLLQYYFSIKPLRDIVLKYDQYKWDTSKQGEKSVRVGQTMVTKVEIEGGQKFAEELQRLFERMIRSRDSAVKPEADLICRAFLKPSYYKMMEKQEADVTMTNAEDEKVTENDLVTSPTATLNDGGKESDGSSMTLVGDGSDDVVMNDTDTPSTSPGINGTDQTKDGKEVPPPLPPRKFSTTKEEALAQAEANARMQQDVTEVHDFITTLLRSGMSPTGHDYGNEQEDLLRDLFSIETARIRVKGGVEGQPKTESESAIQLNVPEESKESIGIYSALDEVFDLQPQADEDRSIEAFRSLTRLGPLVQISIPRIGYNKEEGRAYKSRAVVRLEDELYFDRYIDRSHPQILSKRRQCWEWRKQLRALQLELDGLEYCEIAGMTGPQALRATLDKIVDFDSDNSELAELGVEQIPADPELTGILLTECDRVEKRVVELKEDISSLQKQLDAQFQEHKNIKYRLAAVFIHRGSYGSGHYWIHIHDFANSIWRTYNDETVEKLTNMKHVFEAPADALDGTPTYAVYVAEDKAQEFIDPVCRDPEPAPDSAPATTPQSTFAEDTSGVAAPPVVHTIDPKLVHEGGNQTWDTERSVAEGVKW